MVCGVTGRFLLTKFIKTMAQLLKLLNMFLGSKNRKRREEKRTSEQLK